MNAERLVKWQIQKAKNSFTTEKQELFEYVQSMSDDWIPCEGIHQVYETLIESGLVSNEVLENGNSRAFQGLEEFDWVYRTEFQLKETAAHYILRCGGLDTVCDVFLNGTYIGTSEAMHIPFEREVTEWLLEEVNELVFYFHSHSKMIAYFEEHMPEEYRGKVPAEAYLLKTDDYGAAPAQGRGFRNIGIFDEVEILSVDKLLPENMDIQVKLSQPFHVYDTAYVGLVFDGTAYEDGALTVKITLAEEDGSNPVESTLEAFVKTGRYELSQNLVIRNPRLWWPRNYGEQHMYVVKVEYFFNGALITTDRKRTGIRDIRKNGNMRFECNGRHIRLFGGNFAPIYGPTNVYNEAVAMDYIEKIDLAGMTSIRIWGPSKPYPNSFYDRLDELGILVWQDFPTGGTELPDNDKYRSLICREAELMIRKLKHHPSIYMWCGGNENMYMNEFTGKTTSIGYDILIHSFADICNHMDPERYYHISCPYEGKSTNDPDFGDSHGSRACRCYTPGEPYGVFYSENIRTYPPQYKSMKRWLGEAGMWEEGFVDIKKPGCVRALPKPWSDLLGNNGEEKFGPVQDYYAADNARDLIYKYTAAASQDLYQMYARARRGNPFYKSSENTSCQGFMIWKINDPWPNFYCALIDYYGECAMTYYAVKKAIAPVWIDLDVEDRIYLWGVNDTAKHFSGTIELTAFRMDENRIVKRVTVPAAIRADQADILMNLDEFGPLHWFTVIHASLKNDEGEEVFSTRAFVTRENMLPFPDAKLTAEVDGEYLIVKTDQFARCVELGGGSDGEAFGWMFEDNYFDLLPFEEKRVRIVKRGPGNCVQVRSQYGSEIITVEC